MAPARGTILVLLGVGLFVLTMTVSAATTPDRDVAGVGAASPTVTPVDGTPGTGTDTGTDPGTTPPTFTEPRTLVGLQGGWVTGGNVRMLSGDEEVWRETRADGYFEVSMLDDGTVLAAFANESSANCGDVGSPCARTGFRHLDPTGPGDPRIVSEYSFPVESLTNSEVHAVDRIGDGTYVFTDMDQERIAVVENGSQVWEWRASSFYDAPADPTSRDWLHINDVDVIGEGQFLVSVRNANQLVVVERGEGVVEVINEDHDRNDGNCLDGPRLEDFDGEDGGDVRCGDPSVIKEQHNPQWLGPGAVLVADSENDRVVELHRTDDGDWEPVWILRGAAGISLDWPRDADRLPNGNTLITDSLNRRVVEVNENGTAVWGSGTGGDIPYEADRLPYGEFAGRYVSPGADPTGTTTPGSATPSNGTAAPDRLTVPTVDANGTVEHGEGGTDVPGLTLAVVAMRGTFQWLPFWFGELHLAVTVVSLGLVVGGGVDTWRNRE